MTSRTRWLLALPALLAAHYLFQVARHEGLHVLAAHLTGTAVVDVHLWPPRWPNLSWTTLWPAGPRSPRQVAFEAGLPHLVGLLTVIATLVWLAGARGLGPIGWNVALAGAIFPWLDLAFVVGTYWIAPNDLVWVFGEAGLLARSLLTAWVAILGVLVVATTLRAARRPAAKEEPRGD